MSSWIARQYADIRGNLKWAVLLGLWWVISHFGKKVLELIPSIAPWEVWTVIVLLSAIAFVWIAKLGKHSKAVTSIGAPTGPSQAAITVPGIPTLSNLTGQQSNPTFNPKEFFRLAYFSPITAELENNIKIIAHREQQPEDFYARFIGVGLAAFMYEQAWAYMFKSQVRFLRELNNNVVLPVSKAMEYYEESKAACPKVYETYNFEGWLGYLINPHQLVIRHPSEMIEITHKGRDFLKYLAHYGYNHEIKAC